VTPPGERPDVTFHTFTTALALSLTLAACGGGSGQTVQSTALTAEDLHYVAMGDSYSSGHGTEPKPDTTQCSRTEYSYAKLWAERHGVRDFTFVACQGATTANVLNQAQTAQSETRPQIDALSPRTNMVTITIGGNDTGFADIARTCAESEINNRDTPACMQRITEVQQIVDGTVLLADNTPFSRHLLRTYQAIREKISPGARVYVLGYPQIYYLPPGDNAIGPVTRQMVDGLMISMNREIRAAAEAAGATYVDVDRYFAGHGAGKANPNEQWINDIDFRDIHVSLHPNIAGHAYGDLPALEAATGG
jgi:lysophospholipase L1-like esterase